ncbi:intercellular adhesion molecule 5 [Xiphias gladius]|uniref:intercellular adhesion molecule 5 n=1 Tax=Xiphias gladius TaxID=8245 RepID=UPI001A983625|nr:intercellular adhesion molecule 5 [Xiphias gladius]
MLPLKMLGLLMLMFSLCDADGTCPTDANPLILEPPEVIEEYGSVVFVNCTSTTDYYDEMYWKYGTRESGIEEDSAFITGEMSLADWNVTAECKIKLNASLECSKNLEITIYRNPDLVVVYPIKSVNATAGGTMYELQCDIIKVAPVQNLTVRWYKDNRIIRMDSFSETTKTPVNESSFLTVNVSRGDDGAQVRCEAQLDFGPDGPKPHAISDTHTVSVPYAPEINSKTANFVTVEEGDSVSLNCEAEGNPPPRIHWDGEGVYMTENTEILNITRVNTTTFYRCTATNDLGRTTRLITVHVLKNTMPTPVMAMTKPETSAQNVCPLRLTPAKIVVRFGDPASVNCSTSARDVLGMGWEATVGGTGFKDLPVVTWKVEKLEDWTIGPKCFITTATAQCYMMPSITLYKTPDNIAVSALAHGPMTEGTEYRLKCDIINVAPVQSLTVKWYRGNEHVSTEMFNDTSVTPISVSSVIRVTPKRDYNGALFRCSAELHLGPEGPEPIPTASSEPYTAVVHYKPLIQDCPTHYSGVEHVFRMDMFPCNVDGNPPPTVNWYYQGKRINASESLTRVHSGKYTVEVGNSLGMSQTSVDVTIEYSPSFTCDARYEVEENGKLHTGCVAEGIPTPIITWLKNGKETVSPQNWTKHDSGKYLLTATNKHGTANYTLYLDVLFAPEFKEGNYSKEVSQGENVTFDCSAEGNPAPVILWNYTSAVNVDETTGRRQRSVSVTGATSTNAGVYICVATNKVGSVSRSVTLMMKDQTSAGFLAFTSWWLIPLIVGILILTIVLCKCQKKHGQYSFIPDKAKESTDIPMSTKSEA